MTVSRALAQLEVVERGRAVVELALRRLIITDVAEVIAHEAVRR